MKNTRFSLFEFAMTEIVPVLFKNLSQLIVATSFKNNFESEAKPENKTAVELYMLSDLIIENIEYFAKGLKNHTQNTMKEEGSNNNDSVLPAYNEFAEYLLQNSFSSDHHCRHQSQKVLYALGSKFFAELTEIDEFSLQKWIMSLIKK